MEGLRPAIVKLLRKIRLNKFAHRMYYHYVCGFESREKDEIALIEALERCFAMTVEWGVATRGDYYEFGLFKGYAFWHAQRIAREHSLDTMKFYGFDSFQGLPKPAGLDETQDNVFYEGQYACSKDQVIANLNSKGVDWNRTFLIEGFYSDSLTADAKAKVAMDKAAIALIDCDLYSSAMEALSFLDGLLVDRSILIFDDWNSFGAGDEKGEPRAFHEFFSKHKRYRPSELFAYGTYGKVFVLNVAEGN